jgi:site-specific DNA recombinase
MYVFSRSPKYVCPKCRNKITVEDIDGVFHDELHDFFVSQEKIRAHLESANQNLADKKNRLESHNQHIEKVRTEMRKTYQLYQADQITPEGFGKIYKPLEEQERALTAELPKLQAEVDAIEMHQISAEEVLTEATGLFQKWPKFTQEEKRRIIESIVEKITLTGDTIDITFSYMPSSEELTKRQRNVSGSSPRPA